MTRERRDKLPRHIMLVGGPHVIVPRFVHIYLAAVQVVSIINVRIPARTSTLSEFFAVGIRLRMTAALSTVRHDIGPLVIKVMSGLVHVAPHVFRGIWHREELVESERVGHWSKDVRIAQNPRK